MFITYIKGVIRVMILFLFGSTGEIVTEKSGHLNMGTPGIMCMGATGAVVGAKIYITSVGGVDNTNGFLGVMIPMLFCLLFAGLTGLIYCFIVDTLQGNQNVTGLMTNGSALLRSTNSFTRLSAGSRPYGATCR